MDEPQRLEERLEPFVVEHYKPCLLETIAPKSLDLLDAFRILCAHRHGAFGAQRINRLAEAILTRHSAMEAGDEWYQGRPVLVTRNDYDIELFNGDIGVVAPREQGSLEPRVVFAESNGVARSFAASRLPPVETVFAMTVHKSQGSQFDHVLVVLPDWRSPLLTRELLYTTVTRATKSVTIFAKKDVVRQAVRACIERSSGLRDELWGGA
jgi:exodeoxyribonuclease V alpha subunit